MDEWKIRRWKTIKVEGFQLKTFVNLCSAKSIGFRSLKILDECTMTGEISAEFLDDVLLTAGNRWRITVLGETGLEHRILVFLNRSATWFGLAVFCVILYFQSQFISEIQIYGYERLTEHEIRTVLKDLGFYPGAQKSYDLGTLKTQLFHELDEITWVGITYEGTLAKIEILEGAKTPPLEDTSYPADLCSDKAGYVEQIMVKEGLAEKKSGDYVAVGDCLIRGTIPVDDKTYQREEQELVRFVHAQGEVKLRVLHRILLYQPVESTILQDTGRWIPGIQLTLGEQVWDSDRILRPWEASRREAVAAVGGIRPIPWELKLYCSKEIRIMRGKRSELEILRRGEQQIRAISKEILPKSAEILKKDLSFSQKENIIEMNVLIHSLEETGVDRPILQ